MRRTKSVIIAAFILVLSAGVVAGRLWARFPSPSATPTGKQPSWLADQLDLTPEQRQQMDAIWANVKQQMDQKLERRHALDRERDQAIEDLLGPEQWQAYGRLIDEFRAKRAEIDKDRMNLIHDANDRSRALLSDVQKQRWDQMRQARHDHGGDGHDHHHGDGHEPTSQRNKSDDGGNNKT
ncbi:MAG TPA: Spy/CpxP family protein refolding chaperone [Tepidisphaeraceae bacterium]|nr:Spy/CpxP family protein refolding chaperone [Tepidisphaeraceae bacterium]